MQKNIHKVLKVLKSFFMPYADFEDDDEICFENDGDLRDRNILTGKK